MYKKYLHLERLGKDETLGLLQNTEVFVTAKVDGTNAVVWFESGKVEAGSRNRQLEDGADNGGFRAWLLGDAEQACKLRKFIEENPHLMVYGEWMGENKFLGSLKSYVPQAKGRMVLFDIYDTLSEEYLSERLWRSMAEEYGLLEYATEILAVLCNPTEEDVLEVAMDNHFLLDKDTRGEGVVCKVDGWRNRFGREMRGKLVLDEFKQRRKTSKGKKDIANVEAKIVEGYVTLAELEKNKAKTCNLCNVDDFDVKSGKHIGMMLQLTWKESVLEECGNWAKEFKNPKIDFGVLQSLTFIEVRKFLGLV